MTSKVNGSSILKQVKSRLAEFQNICNQEQVTIIRFLPPETEQDPIELAKYEAARFSTEHKAKTFSALGCQVKQPILDSLTTPDVFRNLLIEANANSVGLIVQNPIPDDLKKLLPQISFEKDIDGMRSDNPYFPTSATSETIYRLVESFAQEGDTVAVVGAGGYVGEGVVKLLKEAGIDTIEIEIGDDETQTRKANIVVSATGTPELLDEQHIIPEHRLVVDAGFIPGEGKPRGDVSRSAYDIPQHLTPVPGGVGPFQMATLLERLVSQVSGREIEPWVYPAPEPALDKDNELDQSTIETFSDVANFYREEAKDKGVNRLVNDDYVLEFSDDKLTISATDERGVIFTETNDRVQYAVTSEDIRMFESYEQELFPERYSEIDPEIEVEDDGWEID
ncbi:Bifunctional protein FolD protein [Acaryochloris thomasi RCC1774]|uniref:methenyltetrahydrofolate cyclohydrolase n=1 Tax=Acaryochloris thomasi RCC1774 TaxID=1764569 RepID=A0A2W1J8G8_9CYAN|nr:bifunctional 5,10-methylenetetrahydrofolate dehydrogenase/5,10-methenyltetrahydrofolate cyclohydrolase [Acaryochloris thomasi]PZD70620.1 Bifunctional protein FolD protein [Acaryochloris thomasi RCC1774]